MFAQESGMDIQKIKELALANGFSLKEQASGNMDLHSYVYEFANAIEQAVKAQAVPERFEIGRLQDRIADLLDERQELYAQLDAGSTEGFILVEKDLVQSIHQSCVKCLDIDLPPIFRATVCTIRDEVAPLIEAQEPTND